MSTVPPGEKSRRRIRGTLDSNAQLLPVLTRTTSWIARGSSPAFTPSTSASATATVFTWISMLFTSFIASPWPSAPMWKTRAPIARKRAWHAATVSAAPPTMIDSSPDAARSVPPLTGASSSATPRAASRSPSRRTASGSMVLMQITVWPGTGGVDDAALARDDVLGLRGGLHHADRPVGPGAHVGGGPGHHRASPTPEGGLRRIDVVHHQGETMGEEVLRHRAAHGPQPHESDGASHVARPPGPSLLRSRRVVDALRRA